ncbi:hypothetical protein [Flavobacterium fluviatile]|uniref:hypothetical protein n=1 Tax=Flavobacterium fluviatile TaxID=1862387 RepID=UPI0013D4636C|nr:hypothetical protein [Flavobacterium fluviatile]
MRWKNYILNKHSNNCIEFWTDYLNTKKDILYIHGLGFDPRTLNGIKTIYGINGTGKRDVLSIRYFQSEEEKDNDVSSKEVKDHEVELNDFLNKIDNVSRTTTPLITRAEQKSIASINAHRIVDSIDVLKPYSDIVVDISAIPRGVFIPLLHKILNLIDSYEDTVINLHVIVTENYMLDALIQDQGVEQSAEFIHGLSIRDLTNTQEFKEVWIAILGEKQLEQYEKIRNSVNPVSTCVVLPFPSKNLRRGDELINHYQDKLLNDNDFDMKNIIYADEQNPFQVYRLISNTIERHCQSLKIFGGTKVIVSALSSKLLTIGAFLAVYENKFFETKRKDLRIGIKHVDSISHKFATGSKSEKEEILKSNELFHMWIAGEPYKK